MIPGSAIGSLSVLNCGEGDIRVTLDPNNPLEVARAERIIGDMLRRGYLLFVDAGDGKLQRATGFDPTTKEYIIADGTLYQGNSTHDVEDDAGQGAIEAPKSSYPAGAQTNRKGRRQRIPASTSNAVGVAPTAGG